MNRIIVIIVMIVIVVIMIIVIMIHAHQSGDSVKLGSKLGFLPTWPARKLGTGNLMTYLFSLPAPHFGRQPYPCFLTSLSLLRWRMPLSVLCRDKSMQDMWTSWSCLAKTNPRVCLAFEHRSPSFHFKPLHSHPWTPLLDGSTSICLDKLWKNGEPRGQS